MVPKCCEIRRACSDSSKRPCPGNVTVNVRTGLSLTDAAIAVSSAVAASSSRDRHSTVTTAACPAFVELVEKGITAGPQVQEVAERYLGPVREKGVDTLVLGCTHYPLLTDVLANFSVHPAAPAWRATPPDAPRETLEAHRLIEEFMIQANVAAAESLEEAKSPLVYRIHDTPSLAKLEAKGGGQ